MKLSIIDKKEIITGTIQVTFDVSDKDFVFSAGQYIQVTIPQLLYADHRGASRNFSILSSPNDKKSISVAYRYSGSGFKKTINDMPIGSLVEVSGPFGDMLLPKEQSRSIVFVAGGIGITPFMSMIRFATEESLQNDITLFYANRDQGSSAYIQDLEDLSKKNPHFKLKSHFGLVDSDAIKNKIENDKIENALWYVVGPSLMTSAILKILSEIGIKKDNIRFEEYDGYSMPITLENGANIDNIADFPVSVLSAIDRNSIISITDLHGNIIYVNKPFLDISKYSKEDLIGKNHRILKSGIHDSQFYADIWNTLVSKQTWKGEIKNKTKEGSFYWIESSIEPILTEDGQVSGYVSIGLDITEKKNIEEKFASNKEVFELIKNFAKERDIILKREDELERFKKAVDGTTQHIIITDLDGVILYANEAVTKTTGFNQEEIIGGKPSMWGRQMPQEFYRELWKTIKDDKKPFIGEIINKRKNGEIYTAFANITPIIDKNGKLSFFIGMETDISKQKELEKLLVQEKESVEEKVKERTLELQEEQSRLIASINSLSFGFAIIDMDNKIIVQNGAMANIFGIKDGGEITVEYISKVLGESFHLSNLISACINDKKVYESKEIVFNKKFLRGIVAPVIMLSQEEKVIGSVLILEDITDAKSMERSKEEFFSIASHELRTPLTAIRGNTQMLINDYKDKITDNDVKEMITDIHDSSTHLISIVNDFLEVSRLEQGKIEIKKEKFELFDLIKKTIKDLDGMSKQKGLSIVFVPPEGDFGTIISDKGMVGQVLVNLLGNAIKFTNEGDIVVKVTKEDGFVKVSVTDRGLGISEANQALLFRKFQQASENVLARDVTQGTGLGLYISRLIITSLGGVIDVEKSVLGEGSTFFFALPSSS